ncbi:hypothetical protein [Microlunatus parietis]|uniref:Uncharacterized protein n=1 Tax=Microlunatus parietis TaxID=682979 RepID=A0A7Y9LCZ6_9ACTN|nr:hypothetical protein [Microlunatus parietis]NYE72225.1 hypothetical protein [Microlunatus parietis]
MEAPDKHVLGPGLLPTPFTAEEIRESSRAGKTIRLLVEGPDGSTFERLNRFRDGDDTGATLDRWNADAPDDVSTSRVTWRELQGHASFPADRTEVRNELVELPLGRLECVRYDTRPTSDAEVQTFWFAPDYPGMPVRYEVPDGSGMMRTTVLSVETG